MDLRLHNKVVLVTAASRGLGAASAQRFAEEGALVAINPCDESSTVRSWSRDAWFACACSFSRVACASATPCCAMVGSIRARSCPFLTWSLKSTNSAETCPETCVPTLTVVTALSVPVAETTARMSPRVTVAKRNVGVCCAKAKCGVCASNKMTKYCWIYQSLLQP